MPGALAVGEILSTGDRITPFPSTTLQLQEVITSQGDWERLVPSNSEPQWRACIAQLLQEVGLPVYLAPPLIHSNLVASGPS